MKDLTIGDAASVMIQAKSEWWRVRGVEPAIWLLSLPIYENNTSVTLETIAEIAASDQSGVD